jgi:O-antigen/teichoic acid export membrane protein
MMSAKGLKARIGRGLGAQGFAQAVQLFIRLAEVPLLLSFWGTHLYGEWLMLSAIPAYLSIGDGGFATAACRDMTIKSGSADRKGTLAVFQSTWFLLIAISISAVFLAFGFVEIAPLRDWLGFAAMTETQVRLVFLLLIGHVLIGFQAGLLNGGFWVAGRYAAGMYFASLTQLFEFGGIAIAVTFGGGPVEAAAGYVAGRAVGTSLMWTGQRKASPWLQLGFAHASLGELKRLTIPALASLAFPLGNALNIQGMRLVVGLALGPSAVAVFSPLRTLSRLALQPRTIINRLIQPELALAFGAEDSLLFRRLFTRSCQFAFWGCLVASLVTGVSGYWVLPGWTGGKIAMDWTAFVVLLVGIIVNAVWYTALMVPYATNRHGRIGVSYTVIYGGFALCLGYFGATRFGLAGVATSILLVEAAMAVVVVHDALQMTYMDLAEWLVMVMRPPTDILGRIGGNLKKRILATPQGMARDEEVA